MTDVADRAWRLIREEARSGPMQMALDEVAAETVANGGPRTVRVFRWQPSTLSLGYRQDAETVDWDYCEQQELSVTRRPTGGGGIYHDKMGDISYSIVAPENELPGDLLVCYEQLCQPVLDAFDRMDVDAGFADEEQPAIYEPVCYLRSLNPAHDILAGGRKICGNAQYRQSDAVIQHGSLSYSFAVETHLDVFRGHDVSPATFRERVTTIREESGIDRSAAVDHVESALGEWADADEGSWTDAELDRATAIVEGKYDRAEWNRERTVPAESQV